MVTIWQRLQSTLDWEAKVSWGGNTIGVKIETFWSLWGYNVGEGNTKTNKLNDNTSSLLLFQAAQITHLL